MYREFIRTSKAEFSIAKRGYVLSRSGWFSERSAAYLASGRPTAIQDTGFSDWLPTGEGVVPFTDLAEASAAIREIDENYVRHCDAAREVAHEYFDADKVLPRLLDQVMGSA